jgi:D-proline reductase (dithiol) PrdB
VRDDLDVALPLRRLHELVTAGLVGGIAPSHYSFQGYLLDPTEFLIESVPAMVEQMLREAVDAVVFVPV